MTATAQFSRPIIVGIVYLAAIVRFLTSLARRKETKPALMNQHGSYRKLLVKRRLVKVMPDILIFGMEMPRNCFECPLFTNCDACEGHECGCGLLGGIGYEEDISEDRRRDDCPLVELPEHGDLIDICNAENALFVAGNYHLNDYKQGWNDGIKAVIENAPVIVSASEEALE